MIKSPRSSIFFTYLEYRNESLNSYNMPTLKVEKVAYCPYCFGLSISLKKNGCQFLRKCVLIYVALRYRLHEIMLV